jgi:hypothetical protein
MVLSTSRFGEVAFTKKKAASLGGGSSLDLMVMSGAS